MKIHGDTIEVRRKSDGIKKYKLQDCSWFVATPRHDLGIAAAWVLVFPNPRVIIIELPERTWSIVGPYPSERAAVGWTDETRDEWQELLVSAGVPEGKKCSREIKYVGPFG